jgi:hypothetical protein
MNLATAPNVVFHYFLYFSRPFANFSKGLEIRLSLSSATLFSGASLPNHTKMFELVHLATSMEDFGPKPLPLAALCQTAITHSIWPKPLPHTASGPNRHHLQRFAKTAITHSIWPKPLPLTALCPNRYYSKHLAQTRTGRRALPKPLSLTASGPNRYHSQHLAQSVPSKHFQPLLSVLSQTAFITCVNAVH